MSTDKLITLIALLGSVLGIVFAFERPMIAGPTVSMCLLIIVSNYFYRNWPPLTRPRELSPYDFMRKIDIRKIKSIKLIGHTGDNLYTAVREKLEAIRNEPTSENKKRIQIQVVVRHPKAEGKRRSTQITGTRDSIKRLRAEGFNIQLQFYQDLPSHRGIICEYLDGKRIIYLSAYYWPKKKSRALSEAMVIKDSINSPNPLAKMLESWISHYQGMGKVHTIVFDFDDTLAPTMTIQVEAWIEAIESALKRKLISEDQLVQAIKEARADRKRYNQCITNIFVEYQMAEQILDAILPGIDNKTREAIDTDRFERRQKLMTGEKGSLFPGVKDALRTLQDKYQLAIVTATSSELVTRFLDKHEVLDCFSIILGKDDPRHTWVNVHSKSILLIEVSGLTGIPLDRLVLIGHNTSDYEPAYQVGVTFIEATQAARSIGKDSLIKDEAKCGRKLHEQFEG